MRGSVRRRGVSLLELVVGVGLLGLVCGPILFSFMHSRKIIQIGTHDLEAVNLAESFVAQVRTLDPALLPETALRNLPDPDAQDMVDLGGGAATAVCFPGWNKTLFKARYAVERLALAPTMDGLPREGKLVLLRLEWKERMGNDRAIQFPTVLMHD